MRTLGRMRGRPCTEPFLVEAEKGGSRLSPQQTFSSAPLGNPVAPSSVTFGDSFPPRGSLRRWYTPATKYFLQQPLLPQNANPNQGTQMGTVLAPLPEQCATTAKTSEWDRAGHKKGGPGGKATGALSSGFLRRKPGSRPEPGGKPRCRSGPAMVPTQPPCQRQPGAAYPSGGQGAYRPWGAAPRGPRLPGGGPHFSREMGRKRAGPSVIGRWLRWNRCRVDPATWVPRRLRRGSPAFFGRKPEERTPGICPGPGL